MMFSFRELHTCLLDDRCVFKMRSSLVMFLLLCLNAETTCFKEGKALSAIIDGLSSMLTPGTFIIWLRFSPRSEVLKTWLSCALKLKFTKVIALLC